ncbi:MAG: element excision factor XisH family protein [bacterium]
MDAEIGTYNVYQSILRRTEPDRVLYLAVEKNIYNGIFTEEIAGAILEDFNIHLVIFDEAEEVILKWIK